MAYINHDIDDAIRAGIITDSDLPRDAVEVVGRTHSNRIGGMVIDIIQASADLDVIGMSEPCREATDTLKDFLFSEVYGRDVRGIVELEHAGEQLKELFRFYMGHPEELPELPEAALFRDFGGASESGSCADMAGERTAGPVDNLDPETSVRLRARRVCDFISGMTDRYAQRDYAARFPKWQ